MLLDVSSGRGVSAEYVMNKFQSVELAAVSGCYRAAIVAPIPRTTRATGSAADWRHAGPQEEPVWPLFIENTNG